jgi:phosphoglycerate dehydrogenase-like enzyme
MRILFCRKHFSQGLAWEGLAPLLPGHEIVTCSKDEVAEHLNGVDIVVPFGAKIDLDLMRHSRFGLIQQFGVGLDTVDLQAATETGIWVARLPAAGTGNAESVAEHAILLMLALARHLPQAKLALEERRWGQPAGTSLLGKTACIVGLGDIGSAIAQRLSSFGMRLIAVRRDPERGAPDGVPVAEIYPSQELHRALRKADYVITCVNYDARSHHLIDQSALAAMKPGSYLINIARGGLVDQEALLDALRSGQVAGAGLDVFWEEPVDPTHPIFAQNVIVTPHTAGITDAFYTMGARPFAENIERYQRGEPLHALVNAPVHPRHPLRAQVE